VARRSNPGATNFLSAIKALSRKVDDLSNARK
jgi:hypothetical protein